MSLRLTMRVIAKRALREFWENHADSEQALRAWYQIADKADWATPADVLSEFPRSSIVGSNKIVFKIRGNEYRLIVEVNYKFRRIWIRFIGTHAEYDKVNAERVKDN